MPAPRATHLRFDQSFARMLRNVPGGKGSASATLPDELRRP
ncbi:hypothetical protein [Chloroflexus sp.]|nr:hypothetical protein [uncultured Chloroflexus sp.]